VELRDPFQAAWYQQKTGRRDPTGHQWPAESSGFKAPGSGCGLATGLLQ